MAIPRRCKVTIDSTSFQALAGSFRLSTKVQNDNLPQTGSLGSSVWVYADMSDTQNLPQATLSNFFGLANVPTNNSVKEMKIEYFQDDAEQDAIASVKFKGWISSFETSNLTTDTVDDDFLDEPERELYTSDIPAILNNLLALKLTVSLNDVNKSEFSLGN